MIVEIWPKTVSCPASLEESGLARVICTVMDGRYRLLWRTVPASLASGNWVTRGNRKSAFLYRFQIGTCSRSNLTTTNKLLSLSFWLSHLLHSSVPNPTATIYPGVSFPLTLTPALTHLQNPPTHCSSLLIQPSVPVIKEPKSSLEKCWPVSMVGEATNKPIRCCTMYSQWYE